MDIICYHAKVEPGAGATEVKATLQVPASKQKFKRLVTYDSKARLLTVETR